MTVITTSPNEQNFSTFIGKAEAQFVEASFFYMPLWDDGEIEALNTNWNLPLEDLKQKLRVFGGVPRYFQSATVSPTDRKTEFQRKCAFLDLQPGVLDPSDLNESSHGSNPLLLFAPVPRDETFRTKKIVFVS